MRAHARHVHDLCMRCTLVGVASICQSGAAMAATLGPLPTPVADPEFLEGWF